MNRGPSSTEESWRACYHSVAPALLLHARTLTRDRAEAEDLVQEAFIRTWRHLHGDFEREPRGLLHLNLKRAAVDLARNRTARSRREQRWASDPALPGASLFEPAFPMEHDHRRLELEESLNALPDLQRELLTLKIWAGLTFAEIADTLEIPLQTAASRYQAALDALQRLLTEKHPHSSSGSTKTSPSE
jgi:RNA polymerase sigma-70 factor, ECF subfamily